MAEEQVRFCNARQVTEIPPFWVCTANSLGCDAFSENFASRSLLGFNEQITSSLSWDPASAPRLGIFSQRPLAANNVSSLMTSESWNLGVDFSIEGSLDAELIPPQVGLSVKGPGGTIDWKWTQSKSINILDWKTLPSGAGSSPATSDFFANGGANSLANLMMYANTIGDDVLSYTDLTDLQQSRLEYRNETDWITTRGNYLPPAKARLTFQTMLNYGEVFEQYAALFGADAGMHSYGALHKFTVTLPYEFDFSRPVLQPPLAATWTVIANLTRPSLRGVFPVQGTVTLLSEPSSEETTILLGAEIYDFGSSSPATTVIKHLPLNVTIPTGQLSTNFNFGAERIGHPYNVRVWAFKANGQQYAYPMTVPATD